MKHSFTSPRQKKVVGAELKWLFSTFMVFVVVMSGSSLFLNHTIGKHERELMQTELEEQKFIGKENTLTAETERLQKLERLRETISTKNRLKKENVKNFFDLVPNEITLELVEFRDKTLRLKGTTASKTHFENSFKLSLESLFSRSTTQFTKLKNGSFRFDNISIVESDNE